MNTLSSHSSSLLFVLVVLLGAFVGFEIHLMSKPQDLAKVKEATELAQLERSELDEVGLAASLRQLGNQQGELVITEGELNEWLARQLALRQEGAVARWTEAMLRRVWVRLEAEAGGRAEIILEREVRGEPQTVSMYLRVEHRKKEDQWVTFVHKDGGLLGGMMPLGGRFGQARMPQGFLLLVKSSFQELGKAFEPELKLFEDLTRRQGAELRIEEGLVRLSFPLKRRN